MNIAQHLTPLTLIAATLAAVFLVQSARAEAPVVRLEPVYVTAQRALAGPANVVRLPRVEVTAARVQPRAAQVVQLPAVEIGVRRSGDSVNVLAQRRPATMPTRNVDPA